MTGGPAPGSPTKGGENDVAINPLIKKKWEEVQKQNDVPVNAIGVKIDPKDANTLRVWREEGIDRFVKR